MSSGKRSRIPVAGRPRVVVSRCLGFGRCRWNGVELPPGPLAGLERYLEFIPVCPECEIGLGVPRDPIRLVAGREGVRLLQPAGGRDLTRAMEIFSDSFLSRLPPVSGFVLKSRSPSCGLSDTPAFAGVDDDEPLPGKNGPGMFARAVGERFPLKCLIDDRELEKAEARLRWLREIGVDLLKC